MCGRFFVQDEDEFFEMNKILDTLSEKYEGTGIVAKRGEVFPGETAAVIIPSPQKKAVSVAAKWGFPSVRGRDVINARSETAENKPLFSRSFTSLRCVVPATGFFEWSHDGAKNKYLFTLPEEKILWLGGLCRHLYDGSLRFVIITAPANDSMSEVHDRMPLIIRKDSVRKWLFDTDAAKQLMHEALPLLEKKAV